MGSFILNGHEFALPADYIQEVVNPPERLTPVPLAPSYLLGIFNLRGLIIPVVDLARLLELSGSAENVSAGRIGIVEHNGLHIGLRFDETGEVLRNSGENGANFDYAGNSKNVVAGAIKLDDGRRIINILNIHALLALEHVPRVAHAARRGADVAASRKASLGARRQCISFSIGLTHCAFDISVTHEIIRAPELKVSPLKSELCVGVFELRGDTVPVLNAHRLLGAVPSADAATADDRRVIIMKNDGEKFGLLVDTVNSLVTYYSEEVLPLPALNPEAANLFNGCLSSDAYGDIVLLNAGHVHADSALLEVVRGHAQLYSRTTAAVETRKTGERRTYITFRVDQLYALGIDEVREIIEYPKDLLRPPGLPKHINGMFNLRGQMVSVIATRVLYGARDHDNTQDNKLLIFERNGSTFGMMVDAVESILTMNESERVSLPPLIYKQDEKGLGQDVKAAYEVTIGRETKTLLVLNLEPLVARVAA